MPIDSASWFSYLSRNKYHVWKTYFFVWRDVWFCMMAEKQKIKCLRLKNLWVTLKKVKHSSWKLCPLPKKSPAWNSNNANVFLKIRKKYTEIFEVQIPHRQNVREKYVKNSKDKERMEKLLCPLKFSTNKPKLETTKYAENCFCCIYLLDNEF